MPETIKCQHCAAPLRLPNEFIGKEVRCPSCQRTFTAELPPPPPPPSSRPEPEPEPEPARRPEPRDSDRRPRRPRDDEDEDYPRTRRPSYDAPRYPLGDRSGVILALGIIGLVMSFLTCCTPLFGIVGLGLSLPAAIMGNGDLAAIKRGDRDPRSEGPTRSGMICGLIGSILSVVFLLLSCGVLVIAMANNGN